MAKWSQGRISARRATARRAWRVLAPGWLVFAACGRLRGDCDQSEDCRERGLCTEQQGKCVAASDDDCKQAKICRTDGRCTWHRDHCLAGSDADCQRSKRCLTFGECRVEGRGCGK
ncbi:MAG: hypothetical protein HY744_28990 [Deltaproteobacteria bacterium]|nr:hypothetical protein [Deltaproteobacteria bacterium]